MARIYVIDDDAQLLRMVGMMLQRGGHVTTLINDPTEGLEALRRERPDLVVLDVMMPYLNGHDLARQIRATKGLEDLPILILTARTQEVDRQTALSSGADDYLSKPVSFQELMDRIDALLYRQGEGMSAEQNGLVLAFYGLRGGRGQTTLAVNVAAALRRLSQQEICLVDFGPLGSQSLMHFRLPAPSSWVDLAMVGELDWAGLLECTRVHSSGVRLLPVPAPLHAPMLPTAEMVQQVVDVLRKQTAVTVLDLPPVVNAAFRAALSVADMAFQVLTPDLVSVQTAVQLSQVLTQHQIKPRQRLFILNHVAPDAQLPKTAVERGLDARIALEVAYDANQMLALTQGIPLALTKSDSAIPAFAGKLAHALWQHAVANTS